MELINVHILLLCISIFFLFSFFIRSNRRRRSLRPPGPSGLPIIGNLLQLGPRPHESLSQLAKVYGPLMSLRLGFNTTIVASSPDMAREILHTNDQTFANRPVPDSVASQPNPEGTLAWVPGDHRWRHRRRICNTQMFTSQRLDFLQHFRHCKVQQLVDHVRKHCAASTPVDIGSLAFATTLNLISNTIFSVDIIDPEFETAQEFKELVWRIMEDAGKPNLSDYFPGLKRFDLQGVRRHVQVSYVRMHQIFDEIIGKRLESRASKSVHGDFLDVLLDQCNVEDGGFSLETIKPLILDLFIAGSDTSGLTTEWAMAELLRKPSVMEKAKKELEQVLGSRQDVKESDIDELPYLQAIVKETLRLHPPAPLLLPYIAGNDIKISSNTSTNTNGSYLIEKGDHVIVNAWSMGRNPEYWKDAMSFSPDRFLLLNNKPTMDYKGRDFVYIPFGAGRRICPGLPLANRMVNLMLASLLHSFNWKLPDGVTPDNLDMSEQFGITLKKALPLSAIPLPSSTTSVN